MKEYLFDPFDSDDIARMKELPEFGVDIPNLDSVLKYIILMYDTNSEYRKLYPKYMNRKRECALKSGFKLNKANTFNPEIESLLFGENEVVNSMIMAYISLLADPDLILYQSFWTMAGKTAENSLQERDDKIIKVIRENLEKFGASIGRLEENIFGGRETARMRKLLYETLVSEKLFRPEEVAKQISEKKLKLGVEPYYQ